MTASTLIQHTARRTAAHGAPFSAHRLGAAPNSRPQRPADLVRELDCEDGCHYCQGPETD